MNHMIRRTPTSLAMTDPPLRSPTLASINTKHSGSTTPRTIFVGHRIASTPEQRLMLYSWLQEATGTPIGTRALSGSFTSKCNTWARDLQIEASKFWNSYWFGGSRWTNMLLLVLIALSFPESRLHALRARSKHLALLIHPRCFGQFTWSPLSPSVKSQTI